MSARIASGARPGFNVRRLLAGASAAAVLAAGSAHAQTADMRQPPAPPATCDRPCLHAIADRVLASMVAHDPGAIPLARSYVYTENNGPSAPGMSSLWRTVTKVLAPPGAPYVIDAPTGQGMVVVEAMQGDMPAIAWGRLKVVDRRITEMEFYLGQSRAEAGAQFNPEGLQHLPAIWGQTPAADARASRPDLEQVARAIFNPASATLQQGEDCELVENGVVVVGDAKGVATLEPWAAKRGAPKLVTNVDGRTGAPFPCDLNPQRPADPKARILVDVDQGVAVAFAMVPGSIYPQFYQAGDGGAFIPATLVALMKDGPARLRDPNPTGLDPRRQSYVPVLEPRPASEAVVELWKFSGGKVRGTHRLMQLQPAGSRSPWTAP